MLFREFHKPSSNSIHADTPEVMPHDHAGVMTAVKGIQGIGTGILIGVRAVNEKQIDSAPIWGVVEGRAVTEESVNLVGGFSFFPNVSFPLHVLSGDDVIHIRGGKYGTHISRQIECKDSAIIRRIESHVCCRIAGISSDFKDNFWPDGPAQQAQTHNVSGERRDFVEPGHPIYVA